MVTKHTFRERSSELIGRRVNMTRRHDDGQTLITLAYVDVCMVVGSPVCIAANAAMTVGGIGTRPVYRIIPGG